MITRRIQQDSTKATVDVAATMKVASLSGEKESEGYVNY